MRFFLFTVLMIAVTSVAAELRCEPSGIMGQWEITNVGVIYRYDEAWRHLSEEEQYEVYKEDKEFVGPLKPPEMSLVQFPIDPAFGLPPKLELKFSEQNGPWCSLIVLEHGVVQSNTPCFDDDLPRDAFIQDGRLYVNEQCQVTGYVVVANNTGWGLHIIDSGAFGASKTSAIVDFKITYSYSAEPYVAEQQSTIRRNK